MNVLVTGGSGFIGSNFIRYLLANGPGFTIVNFDKLTYAGSLTNLESIANDPRYRFVKGDVRDAAALAKAMHGCDAVVHFAAESHVDRSIYEPLPVLETNITGTVVLLEAARKLGISRFVHVSTDEVYGDIAPGSRADEKSLLNPSSPYAVSKASADMLVRSYVRTYALPAMIIRSSNNYGPHQFPEKLVPLLITNALNDKPLPIYGDGLQERNWLHVEDHCRGICAVLEAGRSGEVYNIGGKDVCENVEIARRILRLLGKPESLVQHVTDRPGHDRRYALDSTKIAAELGWRPSITLDEGLSRTVAWYRAHADWIALVRKGADRGDHERAYASRESSLRDIPNVAMPLPK